MTEVSAAAQTQQPQSESKLASVGLADNFDTFLTLLTEQLKNQDPLDPMDSEFFVQQLVQFSSVEQQIASNESLEALLALQQSDAQLTSLQFIGKDATVNTTYTLLKDGEAKWEYGLGQEAQSVELLITDETGKQVRRLDGDTSEGVHEAIWDGKDEAGNTLPAGVYQLEVVAKDADDVILDYAVRVTHRVTGVEMSGGQAQVSFANGELVLPASLVTSVRESTSQPTTPNDDETGSEDDEFRPPPNPETGTIGARTAPQQNRGPRPEGPGARAQTMGSTL